MKYLKSKDFSKKWEVSDRTVRKYCLNKKIKGAKLIGKTWFIPLNSTKPERKNKPIKNNLLSILKEEKRMNLKGGIYHKTHIELTYNSNHIEGSTLSKEETRFIFETNTLLGKNEIINIDDIIETINHFRCFDYIVDNALKELSETMIKKIHFILKSGTSDSKIAWFNIGKYKKIPNEVGGKETCPPNEVKKKMKNLIENYNSIKNKKIEDLIKFHKEFEDIHPFQDGNGRVGRLILFKECLKNNIVPLVIDEKHKLFYYNGLNKYYENNGYLIDTILSCQDIYKKHLDYFKIKY